MKIIIRRKIRPGEPEMDESMEYAGEVFPFYINCLSMDISNREIVFNVLGSHKFQMQCGKLWIFGEREKTATINQYEGDSIGKMEQSHNVFEDEGGKEL